MQARGDEMLLDVPESGGVSSELADQHREVSTGTAREAVPKTCLRVDVPREARTLSSLRKVMDRAPTVDLVLVSALDLNAKVAENLGQLNRSIHQSYEGSISSAS